MLNSRQNALQIFDFFEIDHQLPKFKHHQGSSVAVGDAGINFDASIPQFSGAIRMNSAGGVDGWNADPIDAHINQTMEISRRFWKRVFNKLFGWMLPKRQKVTAQQFFANVKANLEDMSAYTAKVEDYLKVADHARKMGQTALFEEIMDRHPTIETAIENYNLLKQANGN